MHRTLKTLVSVPVVMACALSGTVSLIKLIEKLPPEALPPADGRHS